MSIGIDLTALRLSAQVLTVLPAFGVTVDGILVIFLHRPSSPSRLQGHLSPSGVVGLAPITTLKLLRLNP